MSRCRGAVISRQAQEVLQGPTNDDAGESEHTDIPRIEKREYGGNGKDVIELRKSHHLESPYIFKSVEGLADLVEYWAGCCSDEETRRDLYITQPITREILVSLCRRTVPAPRSDNTNQPQAVYISCALQSTMPGERKASKEREKTVLGMAKSLGSLEHAGNVCMWTAGWCQRN